MVLLRLLAGFDVCTLEERADRKIAGWTDKTHISRMMLSLYWQKV